MATGTMKTRAIVTSTRGASKFWIQWDDSGRGLIIGDDGERQKCTRKYAEELIVSLCSNGWSAKEFNR